MTSRVSQLLPVFNAFEGLGAYEAVCFEARYREERKLTWPLFRPMAIPLRSLIAMLRFDRILNWGRSLVMAGRAKWRCGLIGLN